MQIKIAILTAAAVLIGAPAMASTSDGVPMGSPQESVGTSLRAATQVAAHRTRHIRRGEGTIHGGIGSGGPSAGTSGPGGSAGGATTGAGGAAGMGNGGPGGGGSSGGGAASGGSSGGGGGGAGGGGGGR